MCLFSVCDFVKRVSHSVRFYITYPSACGQTSVHCSVMPNETSAAEGWKSGGDGRGGGEGVLVSTNTAAKQGSCNAANYTHTQTHNRITVLNEWCLRAFLRLHSSQCGQITDIMSCKRDSLSTSVSFSFTLSRGPCAHSLRGRK